MKESNSTVEYIADCLRSAGYDPYAQILGYVNTGNDTYITRKGDARDIIKTVDPVELDRYIAGHK